jgi:hypothetical protein
MWVVKQREQVSRKGGSGIRWYSSTQFGAQSGFPPLSAAEGAAPWYACWPWTSTSKLTQRQYSTVQYHIVQYSTVQYSTLIGCE